MSERISATSIGTPSAPTTSSWLGRRNDRHQGGGKMKNRMLALSALLLGSSAAQAEIVRYPIPNSTFPIAQAVRVSGDAVTTYVSGQVPPVINKDADPASPQAYGDTRTQTVGVLNKIKAILEGLGLGIGDVVKMQVFLVQDARAPMDLKAFRRGSPMFLG